MTVDSHVHFWKYDKYQLEWITDKMKPLHQDQLPEHLDITLKRNGIDAVVVVQSRSQEVETRFLAELAATHPVIKAVIGWIDLEAANIGERLQHFSQYPIVKGYRYPPADDKEDLFVKEKFQRGIAALQPYGYTADFLLGPKQLPGAIQLVQRFPEQVFVIDHCGSPQIKYSKIEDWETHIREIAKYPNVYCKLSGLFTVSKWKSWTSADFYPYLDVVFEAFGTERLLFGSDWPVILLSGIYVQWKSLIEKYMEEHTDEDKANVFGENAARVYRLRDE